MLLLAHRGLWSAPEERNSRAALVGALQHGFGLETDIRDQNGVLVISHDMPTGSVLPLADLLAAYRQLGSSAPLALNIKADGLRIRLAEELRAAGIERYFVFDLSVPELLQYCRAGLRYFTRLSEYEPQPALYPEAAGVWVDLFVSDWVSPDRIRALLAEGKEVALVSPELHRRDQQAFWASLRAAGLHREPGLLLCTDFPTQAQRYLHG